jgi:7-cyano-7-deazaguanine synthase
LAIAKEEGYECYALTINYHQRHNAELKAARKIANLFKVKDFKIVDIDLSWLKSSALTNKDITIPENPSIGIPVTYVPARNTIMMTLALAWAETIKSQNIFIGVNAVDYSGYPDCRPEYIESFQNMANFATKAAVEGNKIKIHTPLIEMTKAEIIREGIKNKVDYRMTVSCYQATKNGLACGKCDSCRLRKEGFKSAQIKDPTNYKI